MFKEKVIKGGLICLVAIAMLVGVCWAIGKKLAQEQTEVKKAQSKVQSVKQTQTGTPTLLWQKEFEQNIGSIDMSKDGSYIVVATNPTGTESPSYVYLLDNSGNILWQYDYDEIIDDVHISKDGNYIAARITKETEYMDQFIFSLLYFDKNGNLLWKKDEIEGRVCLSENGKYILSSNDWMGYYAYLFDKEGNQLWQKEDIGAIPLMTGDGEYILLGNTLFDREGKVIWDKKEEMFIGKSMSDDGNIIAGVDLKRNEKYLWVLDKSGSLLWEYNIGDSIDSLIISPDGRFLVCSNLRNDSEINFFNKEGNLLWKKSYPFSDCGWTGFAMPNNGKYVAIVHHPKDYLWIDFLDQSGNIIGQIKKDMSGIEGHYHQTSLSMDGKYFAVSPEKSKILYLYDNSSFIE